MQSALTFAGLALLAVAEAASPSSIASGFENPTFSSSKGGNALCVEGIVPVKATAKNYEIKMGIPPNASVITQGFIDFVTLGTKYTSQVVGSPTTVSGTYDIYSRLCYPLKGINPKSVQVLTHGIGFDNTYWDITEGYSYIDDAALKGYTTFAYDRLGVGYSDTPDPLKIVQAPLEAEIAYELMEILRSGKLAKTAFKNVVGVGHSFGSALTVAVAHSYPTAMDAIVLTGFSTSTTAVPVFLSALNLQIARKNNHLRFPALDNGYLVGDTITANQFDFFHVPGYPPENLRIAELTKATTTLGELLTMLTIAQPATKYTGAVNVVNGEYDLPFCFGNCRVPSNLAAKVQPELFPKASKDSTTYLAADAAHGLEFHYSAVDAHKNIQSFISGLGL